MSSGGVVSGGGAVSPNPTTGAESRVNTGAVRTTTTTRTEWVPRKYPKWWLIAPSVAAVVGLTAFQVNGLRSKQEDDLEKRALAALRKKFPNARLEFRGRDATISGVDEADLAEARSIVRNVEGVRAAKGSTENAAALTTIAVTAAEDDIVTETTPPIGLETTVPGSESGDQPTDTFAEAPSGPSTTAPDVVETTIATPTVADALAEPSIPASNDDDTVADTEAPSSSAATTAPTTTVPTTTEAASPTTTGVEAEGAAPAAPIDTAIPSLDALRFATGSADVSDVDSAMLERVADYLAANPNVRLAVSGHADSRGTRMANLALSQQRAEAVRDALVDFGVDPAQVTARGFGSRSPIASNDTDSGRAKNRRADLRFVGARTVTFTG